MSKQFEKSLDELKQLVQSLEQGELSLEASMKAFEKGISLSKKCQEALTEAEQKVKILTQGETLNDFDER